MESLDNYINFQQPSLYYAMANIMFNPIFWNVAARVGKGITERFVYWSTSIVLNFNIYLTFRIP